MKAFAAILALMIGAGWSWADDAPKKAKFAALEKQLSGTKFTGSFTIDGREGAPAKEEYTILNVKKIGEGDLFLFRARVKYGKTDITLPMPLPIKWAGDTPVISMDKLSIPGLGTFSAHVVIDGDKYAGTWKHGKVGGHLFGKISRIEKK
ncbi:MAG: hypothetical protein ACKVKM_04855 [Verrucomicrobiia bacterium]|jgi:hypothetical protein